MERLKANQFDEQWALLTAGPKDHFNTMTISWGGMGTLWSKPVITVYVKPCRYTYEFMENNDYFVVSFFGGQYKKDLGILGSRSGRDGDKLSLTSLTPVEIEHGMTYKEATQTIVCRKIYEQDLDKQKIPQEAIDRYYSDEPVHKMYVGEVINIIEK